MFIRLLTITSSLVAVSACGGAETGFAGIPFSEIQSRAGDIAGLTSGSEDDIPVTPFAELPGGEATYTGLSIVGSQTATDDPDADSVVTFLAIGALSATVNLDTPSISASGDNYYEVDPALYDTDGVTALQAATGTAIAGSVTYTLSPSSVTANALAGRATGSVTPTEGDPLSIDLAASGAFIGDAGAGFAIEGFNGGGGAFASALGLKD